MKYASIVIAVVIAGSPTWADEKPRASSSRLDAGTRLDQALARMHLPTVERLATMLAVDEIRFVLDAERKLLANPKKLDQSSIRTVVSATKKPLAQRQFTEVVLRFVIIADLLGALESFDTKQVAKRRLLASPVLRRIASVRDSRTTILKSFARTSRLGAPPTPPPSGSHYTQFVQLSTQLMNELQNTERELVDTLQTQFRNLETFWQTVATFRDETFRTNDRVMTMR